MIDSKKIKSNLQKKFPEALALDMEGIGVASASIFNRIYDWIIIKGISDLGDGTKGTDKENCQRYAMKNAIRVLKEIFDNEFAFSSSELKIDYDDYNIKKVFIASSQCPNGEHEDLTENFIAHLSAELVKNKNKVYSGMGRGSDLQ